MPNNLTPCSVLFSSMKKYGGISNKELASIVLSGRPLADGRSPLSRISDRTWISRFIVHAPIGSIQDRYFCDFGVAAMRIMSRLRSRRGKSLSVEEIVALIDGRISATMTTVLSNCGQEARLYRNALDRILLAEGFSPEERAEMALVLLVATGCSPNVRAAVSYTSSYINSLHGGRLVTPTTEALRVVKAAREAEEPSVKMAALVRLEDGCVVGGPFWLSPQAECVEIGALVLGDDDISDVTPDVSARHARLRFDGSTWLVRDLGSRGGTVVVSGATHESTEVLAVEDDDAEPMEVPLAAGDELHLSKSTVFVMVEGSPRVS